MFTITREGEKMEKKEQGNENNKKSWMSTLVTLGILIAIVLVFIGAQKAWKYFWDRDRNVSQIQTDLEETTVELEEPAVESKEKKGPFDSLTVNNVTNIGSLCGSKEYGMWFYEKGKGLVCEQNGQTQVKYEAEYIDSINISGDNVYFVCDGKPMYYSLTKEQAYEMPGMEEINNIIGFIANDDGSFVTTEDEQGRCRIYYIDAQKGVKPYYYDIARPTEFTVKGEYLYFVNEDGHRIYRCLISEFGDSESCIETYFANDNFVITQIISEGDDIYFGCYRTLTGEHLLFRITGDDANNPFYIELETNQNDAYSISGINIYDGYLYYAITHHSTFQYETQIYGVMTNEKGFKLADCDLLYTTEGNYGFYGIILDPYDDVSYVSGITAAYETICGISDLKMTREMEIR